MAAFRGERAFLSNFYPCNVEMEGIVYPSAEHAFVAYKTLDVEVRKQVAQISTPAAAKRFGRKIPGFRPDWNDVRLMVMLYVLHSKFAQNKELAAKLIATGNEHLEEKNEWGDTYWGTCNGEGKNHLGILLMEVRKELQEK